MASTQKRWLTTPKGRLSKVDLPGILRKDEAWARLPNETRQRLYDLLPSPQEGESAYDVNIHPLNTTLKPYIEEELRKWQQDLVDGKEAKSWREKAMQAGQEREEGKWEEWKQQQRDEWFPDDDTKTLKCEGEAKPNAKSDGDGTEDIEKSDLAVLESEQDHGRAASQPRP